METRKFITANIRMPVEIFEDGSYKIYTDLYKIDFSDSLDDPDLMKVCTGEDLDISKVGVVSDACFVLGAKYGGGVSECADLSKDQVTTQCKAALGLPCSPNNQSTPSPTAVCARVLQ